MPKVETARSLNVMRCGAKRSGNRVRSRSRSVSVSPVRMLESAGQHVKVAHHLSLPAERESRQTPEKGLEPEYPATITIADTRIPTLELQEIKEFGVTMEPEARAYSGSRAQRRQCPGESLLVLQNSVL